MTGIVNKGNKYDRIPWGKALEKRVLGNENHIVSTPEVWKIDHNCKGSIDFKVEDFPPKCGK